MPTRSVLRKRRSRVPSSPLNDIDARYSGMYGCCHAKVNREAMAFAVMRLSRERPAPFSRTMASVFRPLSSSHVLMTSRPPCSVPGGPSSFAASVNSTCRAMTLLLCLLTLEMMSVSGGDSNEKSGSASSSTVALRHPPSKTPPDSSQSERNSPYTNSLWVSAVRSMA